MNKNYFVDRNINDKCDFAITTIGKKSNKQIIEANRWIINDEEREKITFKDFENKLVRF